MGLPGGEQQDNAPLTFELQVLRRRDKMTEARASGDAHRYWVYFDEIMHDMIPFIPPNIRKQLEAKHDILLAAEKRIKADSTMNENSQNSEISKLRVAFADENKYYISKALSRSSIVVVKDEGMVDLEKETIDDFASAIRNNRGVGESVERLEDAKQRDEMAARAEQERLKKMEEAQEKFATG